MDDAAEKILNHLPIKEAYADGLAQPTKEAGAITTDLLKTLRLVLAPIQFTAAFQDRLSTWIDRSVRRVPKEQLQPPAPQILGPAIESLRFEPEGTPIDEMFSQLLSRSMDSQRYAEAHPAFVYIIKQISPDEAQIISLLYQSSYDYKYTMDYDRSTNKFSNRKVVADGLPRAELIFEDRVEFYMDQLNSLNLAGVFQIGNQDPIYENKLQVGITSSCEYRLTEFGRSFASACIGAPAPEM